MQFSFTTKNFKSSHLQRSQRSDLRGQRIKAVHEILIAVSQDAGGKVMSPSPPPPRPTTQMAVGLGPFWDHLKLLYTERLKASFLFYLFKGFRDAVSFLGYVA